jgi:hypothetical protein
MTGGLFPETRDAGGKRIDGRRLRAAGKREQARERAEESFRGAHRIGRCSGALR